MGDNQLNDDGSPNETKQNGFPWVTVTIIAAAFVFVVAIIGLGLPWLFLGDYRGWALSSYVQANEPPDRVALVGVLTQAAVAFVQLLGGILLISVLHTGYQTMRHTQEGLQLARQQLSLSREELSIAREGQITERFTRAIEQLGATDDNGEEILEMRLGGIYALERIARDSPRDYWPIIEVLAGYVRMRAGAKSEVVDPQDSGEQRGRQPDIQAILEVLSRRESEQVSLDQKPLNLARADLRTANLMAVRLDSVDLSRANLEGALMSDIHLTGASLQSANLKRSRLHNASLRAANLEHANLEYAEFNNAELQGAVLDGSSGEHAVFYGANLENASLKSAVLTGGEFISANLLGADLRRAMLDEAIFADANVEGADLRWTSLKGANLKRVKGLTQAQIDQTYMDANTTLPDEIGSNGEKLHRSTLGLSNM